MKFNGFCRLGVECAYKHQLKEDCNHKDISEDIKNLKAQLDVLKNTARAPISIKEEGKLLQRDVKYLKERILFLIADYRHTKERISEPQEACDTEEEETEPLLYKKQV